METFGASRTLLNQLLPDDDPGNLTVREGQFHRVVIGSDRVVCLPRTEAAAARLPERAAVLRALGELDLDFRIPEPLVEGGRLGGDEPPFLVLSRIPGAPLDPDVLDDSRAAEAVAMQYARLLAGLVEAGADRTVRTVLPDAPDDRWQQFAAGVRAELFGLMSDGGRRRAAQELAALDHLPHLTGAMVHGDLGAENVLWEVTDEQPQLSGVIDWDEVTLGDHAEDLAAIGASYGQNLLGRVLAVGGWWSDGMADRIAAIRGTFALQQALSGHRDGDDAELADGLAGYR